MSKNSHSEVSDIRQKWVDDLFAHIQEPREDDEDREDSPSSTSDVDEDNGHQSQLEDSLVKHLEDLENASANNNQDTTRATPVLQAIQNGTEKSPLSKVRDLQEALKNGQQRLDSRYKNIEKLFEHLVALNTARQEEREKHLDFFDSLTSDFDALKLQHQRIRMEYLEEVRERYLKTGHLGFLKEITTKFGEANVLFDCQIVHDLQKNDRLRAPLAALGFHAIYALHPLVYGDHIDNAPEEITRILNFRAELGHHGRYNNVARKETFSAIKAKCLKIISLWKEHVDLIQDYPDDEEEAKAAQLVDYPAEKIGAEIAELDEMWRSWEEIETAIRFTKTQYHGLLNYHLSRDDQGELDAEFYRRHLYVVIAMLATTLWLLVFFQGYPPTRL